MSINTREYRVFIFIWVWILANSEYSNIRGILASIDFVVRTNTRIRECILMKHFNPALCGFLQMLLMFQSPLVIAAHKLFWYCLKLSYPCYYDAWAQSSNGFCFCNVKKMGTNNVILRREKVGNFHKSSNLMSGMVTSSANNSWCGTFQKRKGLFDGSLDLSQAL